MEGFKIMNAMGVAVMFTVLFGLVHVVAMYILKDSAMTNHVYLGLQALLAGVLFYLVCYMWPAMHKMCCDM
jgi:xanthine/uracil/vitamin C permease (AzgA family)